MTPTLTAALGALASNGRLAPQSARQLTEGLQIVASAGAALNRDVALSLEHLARVGRVDRHSGTVDAGGGVRLAALDAQLAEQQLSLGPLSPRAKGLTVAEFLEGADAGLRAIPGGRLEPICLSLTAVLADGRVYRSHPSPRSAAGPDLVALLLGGQRRLGVVTEATLRCFPFAATRRSQVFSFPSADAFVAAVTAALADGVWLDTVRVEVRSDRAQVELNCLGSRDGVERDLASVGRRAFDVGGRATGRLSGEFPIDAQDRVWTERESTWDAVRDAVAAGKPLALHRLSLASVIARGDAAGLALDHAEPWPAPQAALAAALDPRGVLGGAP